MKVLGVIGLAVVLVFCAAEDPVDPPDEFQCHILYEYDASVKGEVTSPYYGKRPEYYDELWCESRIRAPEGYRIKITFKVLDIVPSGGCIQDKLIVYGKDKQSVLGLFCGTELPHPMLSNEGENEIRLLFQTDYMGAGKGFVLEYESGPNLELCDPGYTQCTNRNCYDSRKKCDGVDDCGDGTDEEDCGFPVVVEPENCGNPAILPKTTFDSQDRLVGGEAAIPNSWPWQVSLQYAFSQPNGHFCGGSLINAQWVVTASHCVAGNYVPQNVKIQIGSHYKFKKTKYEQTRTGVKIIAYPDLELEKIRTFTFNDDVTLIKLNAPVKFNDGVQPACLPQLGWKLETGMACIATGWGETRGSGASDQLKQMEQFIQSPNNCSYNEQTQICVGKHNNSPCHGDSGGPLSCKLGGKWYVFGAASFVSSSNMMSGLCAGFGAKTVYANVADKAEWIRTIINKYS